MAVQDASALIDLLNGGVLAIWCGLGIQTLITDFVLEEIDQEDQRRVLDTLVEAGLLEVHTTASKHLSALVELRERHRISLPDASTIQLARSESAVLLCGDARMRKTALEMGVPVCGVLWICDMLVWEGALTPAQAAVTLEKILAGGAHLPPVECAQRLSEWTNDKRRQPRNPWSNCPGNRGAP
ncbi:MAG: hypothetical protein U1F87_10840 [Kiritimatiellia bacterium]